MKHNLKNRPKRFESSNYYVKDDVPFQWYSVKQIEDWFEGFEAELRTLLAEEKPNIRPWTGEFAQGVCSIIKGILGEEVDKTRGNVKEEAK